MLPRRVRLAWIEVRPDGFTITQNASKPENTQFFDQRAIASSQSVASSEVVKAFRMPAHREDEAGTGAGVRNPSHIQKFRVFTSNNVPGARQSPWLP